MPSLDSFRIQFPADSGVTHSMFLFCQAINPADFSNLGAPNCVSGVQPDGSHYMIVQNLTPGKFQYEVIINGFTNSNVGKTVYGIRCDACADSNCNTITDTISSVRQIYLPMTVQNMCTVTADQDMNGAKDASVTVSY